MQVADGKREEDLSDKVLSDQVIRNLQKFTDANKLQRAFMHYAVNFLNDEERDVMLQYFKRLNTADKGTINANQMTEMLIRSSDDEQDAEAVRRIVEVRFHQFSYLTTMFATSVTG